MNKIRRKELQDVIDQLEELKGSVEDLMGKEEEYRDNIPENLQGSVRYEATDSACDALQEAMEAFDEVISNIETAIE